MNQIIALRSAVLAARKRTGDNSIGTSVQGGLFRAERVTFSDKGISTVVPLTEWSGLADVVAYLNAC